MTTLQTTILNLIQTDYEKHFTPNEILEQMKRTGDKHPKASIYNCLNRLCELHLIQRFYTSDGVPHYEGILKPHIHLYCTSCKKLRNAQHFDTLSEIMKKEYFGEMSSIQFIIASTCEACSK